MVIPTPPMLADTMPQVVARMSLAEMAGAQLELARLGDEMAVVLERANERPSYQRVTVPIALMLLTDRRIAPLWPALLDWAGADLVKLRDRDLARARTIYEGGLGGTRPRSTIESSVRPAVRAVLQYASALSAAGHPSEASALVTRERDAIDRTTKWGRAEWIMLTIRQATLLRDKDRSAAIDALANASREAPAGDVYAINLDMNRAAYLAEDGRHAEALTLIDSVRTRYAKIHGDKVPGSARQFAWVKACALAGLGRGDEARHALAPILGSREPHDGTFVLSSNDDILWRAYRCMGDSASAARLLFDNAAEPGIVLTGLTVLQPGLRGIGNDAAFAAKVRADPALASVLAARMRVLPATLTPALNGWRD